MDILFLPSWYESEEEPRSGIFFTEQALALKNENNRVVIAIVDILNFPYKCNAKKFRIIEEKRHGIDIYRIKVPSLMTGRFPSVFFKYYELFYIKLFEYIFSKGLRFDIMYAHSFWHAGYIGTILKKRYKIPLIVQEHRSMLISYEFSSKINKYLIKTVDDADAFYCVSEKLRSNIRQRGSKNSNIAILPNMVENQFAYSELNNTMFSYTFVGNLIDSKRVVQLVKCFDKISQNKKDIILYIAGEGPLRTELEIYIENHTYLKKKIKLLGLLSREEIRDLLKNTNVLVLPSTYETFGVVYIEALATGRPVIATKNGGANDIVNSENGILIDVDNDQQLCDAMNKIYEDYSSYDLVKISNDCIKKYSERAVIGQLTSKMKEILYDQQ